MLFCCVSAWNRRSTHVKSLTYVKLSVVFGTLLLRDFGKTKVVFSQCPKGGQWGGPLAGQDRVSMAPLAVASGLACNVPSFTVQRKITSWSKTTQQKTTIFLHIYIFLHTTFALQDTHWDMWCDRAKRDERREKWEERRGKREEKRGRGWEWRNCWNPQADLNLKRKLTPVWVRQG